MNATTWLLTRRTLLQFPRNPMVLGFSVAPVQSRSAPTSPPASRALC